MFIYLKQRRSHTKFVTPAVDNPSREFMDAEGEDVQFTVRFVDGRAEVTTGLGEYMIAHRLAYRDPPPAIVIQRAQDMVPEQRVRQRLALGSI